MAPVPTLTFDTGREAPQATADDHGNTLATASRLNFGTQRTGAIEVGADFDMFVVDLVAGHSVTIEALRSAAVAAGGLSDPQIALYDGSGKRLAHDDEGGGNSNARLQYTVPTSGSYYIWVADYDNTGTGTYLVGAYRRNIVNGSSFNDITSGTAAPDTMLLGRGNDSFSGGAGDDLLDGGEGIDTITYSGSATRYALEHVPTNGWHSAKLGWVITDKQGTDGNDIAVDVERIRFSDVKWALDVEGGAAGTTVKILGAVFGKEAIQIREYVGIGLSEIDKGTPLDALRQLALNAKLGANPSNAAVVTLLYTNVAGVAPSAADLNHYTGLLANGTYTQASLVGLASDHAQNLINIGFEALIDQGIGYV